MKQFYDKKHKEREFAVGDWVFLKLQKYKQNSVAYRLDLPPSAKIHPVFHVSLLKKKVGESTVTFPHLPPAIDPTNLRWYPAAVLDRRMFKDARRNVAVIKWLIHWLGTTPEDATWEKAEDIRLRYPDFTPCSLRTSFLC